jgi:CheY-like chemotaxis protein
MAGGSSILVVEDDTDLRDCVREELEDSGYRVTTAGNGREGLDLLDRGDRPCLILLDLMMPVMTGYEFLAELRGRDADIPVVVMSAFLDAAAVLGPVSETLPKPFRHTDLLAVVRRYC